jgi:hypothetical protein
MIELVFGFGLYIEGLQDPACYDYKTYEDCKVAADRWRGAMSPWKREVYCVDREGNKIEEPLS